MTTRSDREGAPRDGGDAGDPQARTDTRNELATAQQGDEARQGVGHGVVPPGGLVLHGIAGLDEGEGWAAELQRQLRREQGRRQELEGEVHDLEEEVHRLRRQLKDERDKATRDMDVLRERLREKTNEIDRLNDIIRDLRSELRDVKGELADVKHQHKREMAAMRDEYMGRMDAMQQHLEKLDARERRRDAVVVARHVAREFLNCVAASTLQRWQLEPEPLNDHARTWRDVMKIMKDWKAADKKPIADKMWSIAQDVAREEFGVTSSPFTDIVFFEQASGAPSLVDDGSLRAVDFNDLPAPYRGLADTFSALRDNVCPPF